jgi:beta-carotene hydroxylase
MIHDSTGLPGKSLLLAPSVAWPTLALFTACLAAWSASFVALTLGWLPSYLCVASSSAAAFAIFTPMHEAAHRSVARFKPINEIVGRLSALVLTLPFPPFRFLHIEHHKFTNEPDADPDFWTALPPAWLLPFRWASLDFAYLAFYQARSRLRPFTERLETWLVAFGALSIFIVAAFHRHTSWVLLGWVLPSRVATFSLALAFDYLPHAPHVVSSRVDRFRATTVRSDALLTPVLLYQNYHLMHHLYPAMPFYRYARAWRAQRQMLLAKGALDRGYWCRIGRKPPRA